MCQQLLLNIGMQFGIKTENALLHIDNSLYHVAEIARQHGVQVAVFYWM